jgi:hypothetical protein
MMNTIYAAVVETLAFPETMFYEDCLLLLLMLLEVFQNHAAFLKSHEHIPCCCFKTNTMLIVYSCHINYAMLGLVLVH